MRAGWPMVLVSGAAGVALGIVVAPWVRPAGQAAAPATNDSDEASGSPTSSPEAKGATPGPGLAAKLAIAASSIEAAKQVQLERAKARDQQLAKEDAPPGVRAALERWWKGKPVDDVRIVRKWRGEDFSYQAQFAQDGIEHELDMDGAGRLLKGEVNLAPSELPAAVLGGIQAQFSDAVVIQVEKLIGEGEETLGYEVDLRSGGKLREVKVSPDGQTIRDRRR